MKEIAKYDLFEIFFEDFSKEQETEIVYRDCAEFIHASGIRKKISAFRSGEHRFTIRFLPEEEGIWKYEIHTTESNLEGEFLCIEPGNGQHGVVKTKEDQFLYADGTRFFPFGTTCYAWIYQSAEIRKQTIQTLKNSCFNKIRMLVFPKYMPFNTEEPPCFPFGKTEQGWQIQDLNFAFWNQLDQNLRELEELGIEADLILFHPYDKWGLAELSQKESLSYVEYCIARFGAFHNIWWSLANEYEMVVKKSDENWDEIGTLLYEKDPYHHLISIHDIMVLYPKKKWMTHCSIQSGDLNRIPLWKEQYEMPIVIDECGYEGDLSFHWGNLSARGMTDRFWKVVTRGGYCTHGETFYQEDEILWWGKGGTLHGESEPRIRFLKELLEELPGCGKAEKLLPPPNPNEMRKNHVDEKSIRYVSLMQTAPEEAKYGMYADRPCRLDGPGWQLYYFEQRCPGTVAVEILEGETWRAERIDTWEMTREQRPEDITESQNLPLPGKPGMALLLKKCDK